MERHEIQGIALEYLNEIEHRRTGANDVRADITSIFLSGDYDEARYTVQVERRGGLTADVVNVTLGAKDLRDLDDPEEEAKRRAIRAVVSSDHSAPRAVGLDKFAYDMARANAVAQANDDMVSGPKIEIRFAGETLDPQKNRVGRFSVGPFFAELRDRELADANAHADELDEITHYSSGGDSGKVDGLLVKGEVHVTGLDGVTMKGKITNISSTGGTVEISREELVIAGKIKGRLTEKGRDLLDEYIPSADAIEIAAGAELDRIAIKHTGLTRHDGCEPDVNFRERIMALLWPHRSKTHAGILITECPPPIPVAGIPAEKMNAEEMTIDKAVEKSVPHLDEELKEQIKRQLLAPVDKSMPHKMGLTSPGMVECGPCGRQHHAGHPECLANSTVAEAPEFKFQRGPTFYCQSEED